MKYFTVVTAIILGLGTALALKPSALQDLQVATTAAYRDGYYLGKLAGRRGEQPHIAAARWANQADRVSFSSGYDEGYSEIVDQLHAVTRQKVFSSAAYRDGLYIGGINAQQGRTQDIPVGRWSRTQDRAAFTAGYLQGYLVMTDFSNRRPIHVLSELQSINR